MNTQAVPVFPGATAFKKATAREIAALLLVAWAVPFAVHLVPWSGARPLGAYLLPMFWATFVAGYFYGARLAVLVGLFAPAVNLLLTGLPAWRFLSLMSCELVVFALVATWAVRRWPRFVLSAPLAYVVAHLAATVLQLATGVWGDIGAPGDYLVRTLVGGLAGLVVLSAINAAAVWFYPKETHASRE